VSFLSYWRKLTELRRGEPVVFYIRIDMFSFIDLVNILIPRSLLGNITLVQDVERLAEARNYLFKLARVWAGAKMNRAI
jgi:hypothetical protein